jgi:hypothetical protein
MEETNIEDILSADHPQRGLLIKIVNEAQLTPFNKAGDKKINQRSDAN